jgi:hypothetical protein
MDRPYEPEIWLVAGAPSSLGQQFVNQQAAPTETWTGKRRRKRIGSTPSFTAWTNQWQFFAPLQTLQLRGAKAGASDSWAAFGGRLLHRARRIAATNAVFAHKN